MSQEKYIDIHVHQATISVAVMDAAETKASTIVAIAVLRRSWPD